MSRPKRLFRRLDIGSLTARGSDSLHHCAANSCVRRPLQNKMVERQSQHIRHGHCERRAMASAGKYAIRSSVDIHILALGSRLFHPRQDALVTLTSPAGSWEGHFSGVFSPSSRLEAPLTVAIQDRERVSQVGFDGRSRGEGRLATGRYQGLPAGDGFCEEGMDGRCGSVSSGSALST